MTNNQITILERNILAPTVGTKGYPIIQMKWVDNKGRTKRAECSIQDGKLIDTTKERSIVEIKVEMYNYAKEKGLIK